MIKRRDKKRETTGVKAGGGLGEENIFDFKGGDAWKEGGRSKVRPEMFDSAALGVNIIAGCKSKQATSLWLFVPPCWWKGWGGRKL